MRCGCRIVLLCSAVWTGERVGQTDKCLGGFTSVWPFQADLALFKSSLDLLPRLWSENKRCDERLQPTRQQDALNRCTAGFSARASTCPQPLAQPTESLLRIAAAADSFDPHGSASRRPNAD